MKKYFIGIGIVAFLLLTLVPTVYFYLQYQKSQEALKENKAIAENDVEALIKRIAQHVELPEGETPTVAAVNDINQLKNQPFFARAKNGDKVLVYKDARKAYLYDPVGDKIREIGPVTIDATASAKNTGVANSPTPSRAPLPVAIVNGTTTSNISGIVEADLLRLSIPTQVVARLFGTRTDYARSMVIDVTGANAIEAAEVARIMQTSVQAIPEEEKKNIPSFGNAAIVILIGADYVSRVMPTSAQ